MKINSVKTAFIIFIVVALIALLIVLNKGHIGTVALVYTEPVPERKIEIKAEKEFLSSVDKEVLNLNIYMDGVEIVDGYQLTSSDESIIKINEDNQPQAVSDGKAIITVQYDGSESEIEGKVITPIKTLSLTTTSSTNRVGKELQLKLKITPSDASIDTLSYQSSDETIATVNANGIVTGVSAGKVTITVTDAYSGMEKTVNLTVRN